MDTIDKNRNSVRRANGVIGKSIAQSYLSDVDSQPIFNSKGERVCNISFNEDYERARSLHDDWLARSKQHSSLFAPSPWENITEVKGDSLKISPFVDPEAGSVYISMDDLPHVDAAIPTEIANHEIVPSKIDETLLNKCSLEVDTIIQKMAERSKISDQTPETPSIVQLNLFDAAGVCLEEHWEQLSFDFLPQEIENENTQYQTEIEFVFREDIVEEPPVIALDAMPPLSGIASEKTPDEIAAEFEAMLFAYELSVNDDNQEREFVPPLSDTELMQILRQPDPKIKRDLIEKMMLSAKVYIDSCVTSIKNDKKGSLNGLSRIVSASTPIVGGVFLWLLSCDFSASNASVFEEMGSSMLFSLLAWSPAMYLMGKRRPV